MPITTLSAGTIANVAGANTDWGTPTNAGASNNSYATVEVTSIATLSDPLRFTNFTFTSIPTNAVIRGIGVSIEAKKTGLGNGRITSAQLVDGGSAVGTLDGTNNQMTGSDVVYTYGGGGNDWGYETPRSILDADFGFQIIAEHASGGNAVVSVDHATLNVHWEDGGQRSRTRGFSRER